MQKNKFDDFKTQIRRELEQLKCKTSETRPGSPSGLTRATSAACLGGPSSTISDPTCFDPTIVRINAKGIIERDKVWEAAAKLLAAANISEAEVDLLPKAPMAKGCRLHFTSPGPTATTQAKQLVDSLRSGKGTDASWQEVFVTPPDNEAKDKIFIGLDSSRLETANLEISKRLWTASSQIYRTSLSRSLIAKQPSQGVGSRCRTPAADKLRK